jgi:hypothetical protein
LDGNKQTGMQKAEDWFAEKQKKTAARLQVTPEYMSEAKARAVKTAKLRELRLAKEEADRAAGSLQPPKVRAERPQRSIKGKTLSSRILLKTGKG